MRSPLPCRIIANAVALSLCGAGAVRAQDASPSRVVRHVDRYTTEAGLADNNISVVQQDRTGFIWVLTRNGVLQRFDGHSFTRYDALVGSAPLEIAGDVIMLARDRDGFIWAATARTLFRLDEKHRPEYTVPLEHGVTVTACAPDGRLWFLDGGLLRWVEPGEDGPIVGSVKLEEELSGSVLSVGRGGAIWIAKRADRGTSITRLNVTTGETWTATTPIISDPTGLLEDPSGRTWLTGEGGLAVLDTGSRAFRSVTSFRGARTTPPAADDSGGFVVATEDRLTRISASGQIVERWTSPEAFGRRALPNAILFDRERGVWLGTTTAGLLRLHTRASPFEFYSTRSTPPLPVTSNFVMSLFEQADGTLFVGTLGGGIYRVSPDWRQVQRMRTRSGESRRVEDVWDIERDADGTLWIGTTAGICRLIQSALRCRDVGAAVVDIERDASGWLWLALAEQGLISFDPKREVFGERVTALGDAPKFQPAITLFAERDSGLLWVGAGSALLRMRVERGRLIGDVKRIRAPLRATDQVYDFHRRSTGDLFAATGGGLLRLAADSSSEEFVPVDVRELRESTIFSIAEDHAGRLWLGSSHGLVQYAPSTSHARRFTRRDNFLGGELNRRAAILRQNGDMLFGGIEGITQFDPNAVAGAREQPPVVFTRWSRMTSAGPVDAPITGERNLRMGPGDRAFLIEFAALGFSPNPGRRYRHRLEGLNAAWVEGSEHVANYAAPPPGRYVLRVQATSGGSDEWAAPGASLVIDVIPPFWKTSGFRIGLGMTVAMLVWLAHRWRIRQAVIAERLRLRISRDLHDELGAGLSSIALLADAADGESGAIGQQRTQLRRIGESARSMVEDLREIVWAIDPEADRTSDVVTRMRDVAADLLQGARVIYDLRVPDASHAIGMEVRRDLLLLYKEILHNVARHSKATEVKIGLHVDRGQLTLTVADNGVGFSPDGANRGTGLRSLHERAARMGGNIAFDSAPGRGTTVRFSSSGT